MSKSSLPLADYNHLITTRPHDIQQVVISDLHLSADEPALVQAFLYLLNDLIVLPNLQKLFIAGDWFDTWIGDDAYLTLNDETKQAHWLTPIIEKLSQLQENGCRVLIMHGNRDFLIGQPFCDSFNGQLIFEPYSLKIGSDRFRLEHGDALCTDDIAYQRFRRVMRNRLVQKILLSRSLEKREALADKMRAKSHEQNASKAEYVMDVNDHAVDVAIRDYDALLHGHTHRPDIHALTQTKDNTKQLNRFSKLILSNVKNLVTSKATQTKQAQQQNKGNSDKFRYVLGDWRVINKDKPVHKQRVEAVIGVVIGSNTIRQSRASFQMVTFVYNPS